MLKRGVPKQKRPPVPTGKLRAPLLGELMLNVQTPPQKGKLPRERGCCNSAGNTDLATAPLPLTQRKDQKLGPLWASINFPSVSWCSRPPGRVAGLTRLSLNPPWLRHPGQSPARSKSHPRPARNKSLARYYTSVCLSPLCFLFKAMSSSDNVL